MKIWSDAASALPEIFLAVAAMVLLLIGAHRFSQSGRPIAWLSIIAMIVAAFMVLIGRGGESATFNNLFLPDRFASFAKLLILLGAVLAVVLSFS